MNLQNDRNSNTGKAVMKRDAQAQRELRALREALETCDALVIGAGAGLSTSAGYIYTGENFKRYFADFQKKYGFDDMYSGGFYPYREPEVMWAYWSRYIYVNRYLPIPTDLYDRLHALVKDKDYFVLTTNVDHCFQRSGFDKKRLFYTQGDYGLWQCSRPCCRKTYENRERVKEMLRSQGYEIGKDGGLHVPHGRPLLMRIPTELIPTCPRCGEPLTMNLRSDHRFVEDAGWERHAQYYSEFLLRHQNSRVLFLELGVGYNTPGIIKFPFMRMTKEWPHAMYACLNWRRAGLPENIQDRAVSISGDIGETLRRLQAET